MTEFFSWQKKNGEPVQVAGVTVTPQSQVLQIQFPPFGGYVWHRPLAVLVERNGESDSQTIPIHDVTRQAIWAFIGLTILVNLLLAVKRKS